MKTIENGDLLFVVESSKILKFKGNSSRSHLQETARFIKSEVQAWGDSWQIGGYGCQMWIQVGGQRFTSEFASHALICRECERLERVLASQTSLQLISTEDCFEQQGLEPQDVYVGEKPFWILITRTSLRLGRGNQEGPVRLVFGRPEEDMPGMGSYSLDSDRIPDWVDRRALRRLIELNRHVLGDWA